MKFVSKFKLEHPLSWQAHVARGHDSFMTQKHQKALCDPHNPPNAKTQVWRNMSQCAFLEFAPGPPEQKK
jgi:hypothetical protein